MAKSPPRISFAHTKAVKSLYKRCLRNVESWYFVKFAYRYEATLMRKRYDDNKCLSDPKVSAELVKSGEDELFDKLAHNVRKYTQSPGGTDYLREVPPPDWVVDHWHPLEKAQYPEYFARREERKKEFVKYWVKKYCPSSDGSMPKPLK